MKRRAFTLLEMLFTLIIMGIIATIAFPTYQSFVEDSRARVCETNLRALKTALDIYAMDHDNMPGALGALPQEYINKAYAQVMQRPDAWKTKLAYSILEWDAKGIAYANEENFLYKLAKGNIKLITCPSASSPPSPGSNDSITNPSYVLNGIIVNKTSLQYRDTGIIPLETILISDVAPCHKHVHIISTEDYSIGITREGNIKRY